MKFKRTLKPYFTFSQLRNNDVSSPLYKFQMENTLQGEQAY